MRTVLVLLLLPLTALAADAGLSWTHPTQRVDNTALALSEIKETQIEYGVCGAGNTSIATVAGTKAVAAPAATTTIDALAYGTWCFRARTVPVVNPTTDFSAWTGVVWAQYLAPPKPPVFGVVNITAYEVTTSKGGYRLAKVGTVPLGTPCGEVILSKRSATYAEVPLDAVTLTRMPRSAVVVAKCEVT